MDRKKGHLSKDISKVVSSLQWIKVIGVGNTSTGKTCLIKNFCESKFTTGYQPTVGVDYGFKIQNVGGEDLRVHLWDLSGNADYFDVRNELYGQTDGIFLVFDVTSQSSFDGLDNWIKEVTKYANGSPFLALVGNKADLKSKRVINKEDAKKWASAHKLTYFETSASSGEGVEGMFGEMLQACLKKRRIRVTV